MKRNYILYLDDILKSIHKIETFTDGYDFERFKADDKTLSACEYDFSQSIKNPYAKKVKKQISLNVDIETIDYFKALSAKVGMPYQTLINSFLMDCAMRHVEPKIQW